MPLNDPIVDERPRPLGVTASPCEGEERAERAEAVECWRCMGGLAPLLDTVNASVE